MEDFRMRARKTPPERAITPFAYTIKDLVTMGGHGCRATVYNLIAQGELEKFNIGRAVWVTAESVERRKARLLAAARKPNGAPTAASAPKAKRITT
jgi:hypothetical protein